MGILLSADCACGFKTEINVDRGKIVNGPTCYAPALCNRCQKLLSFNYAKKKKRCPECKGEVIFYNNKALQKTDRNGEILKWGMDLKKDFILPKAQFKCPKCAQFNLKFKHVGYFD